MKSTRLNNRLENVTVGCNRLKLKINKYREHTTRYTRHEILSACDALSSECIELVSDLMTDKFEKETHRKAAIDEAILVYGICYNLKQEIGDMQYEIQNLPND